jgi:DNA modification methylase
MDPASVQCCVTSPPYWGLRDYGHDDQIGLEKTPEEYVARMVDVFRGVRRVLRDDGTLWLNLGDSYAAGGHGGGGSYMAERKDAAWQRESTATGFRSAPPGLKPKDLVGIPWRVAFALQADGWYLRSDIIWAKPNPMPESVTDRPTKAHEYLFLLTKSARYFYDADAVREDHTSKPIARNRHQNGGGSAESMSGDVTQNFGSMEYNPHGRNRRTVWTIPTQPFPGAHFAVFPPALVEPCILAGSKKGDTVLDPFAGSGTVGVVCRKHERDFIGIEINPEYARMARGRLGQDVTEDAEAVDEMPLFA